MTTDVHNALPLAGVRVVAVEHAAAAPLATRHLADFGAEVIKVERLKEGDFARAYDDLVRGASTHFVWLNRGKMSVAVDLKDERGRRLVHDLVATADVFIQDLGPGSAARLGLDATTLRGRDPRLVVVDVSGYGAAGPLSNRLAYDMLVQAETGLISITGTPDAPAKAGIPISDIAAGMYVFASVLGALFRRTRTGDGAHVQISMFDATAEWMSHSLYRSMYTGRQQERMGVSHASIAPYDVYPTSDGQRFIGVQNDREWARLCREVFSDDALADDPRFTTNRLRVQYRVACDAAVAERTARFTDAELEARLAEVGVAAARFNDVASLLGHPQLQERDRWREVGTDVGRVRALLPPMIFEDVELPMGDVPALGQHTDEVLRKIGLDACRTADLRAAGVIQ